MRQMNSSRILLGGLVAGLIMNGSEAALHAGILGDETGLLYEKFRIGIPDTAVNLILLVFATFALGLVAVWLYAAIRPRYGAGPRTAMIAGVTVWLLSHLWSGVYSVLAMPESLLRSLHGFLLPGLRSAPCYDGGSGVL